MIQIAAGGYHTCALLDTGGVKCWGYNSYGQLGDNSGTGKLIPTAVSGLSSGVTQIVAGYEHTCARLDTGGVKCWGRNNYGQLGDNSIDYKLVPTDVSGLSSGVTQIAAGGHHTCARLDTGGLKCWGYNSYGQLGDNSTTNSAVPALVSELSSGVTGVAGGSLHTCARLDSGGVKCWGYNLQGQLGDNSMTNKLVPTAVSGLSSGVTQITADGEHTCALLSTGGLKCWGSNGSGQLGDGSGGYQKLVPTAVSGLSSGVTGVSAGSGHTCASLSTGGAKCWGYGSYGQIGDGATTSRYVPSTVLSTP